MRSIYASDRKLLLSDCSNVVSQSMHLLDLYSDGLLSAGLDVVPLPWGFWSSQPVSLVVLRLSGVGFGLGDAESHLISI